MTKKKVEQPEAEAAVLFPEERVGPYRFRPWSPEQFAFLVGALTEIILRLPDDLTPQELKTKSLKYLPPVIRPFLPDIIGITLGLTAEEVAGINPALSLALGIRILSNEENQEQIKNFMSAFLDGNAATPTPNP